MKTKCLHRSPMVAFFCKPESSSSGSPAGQSLPDSMRSSYATIPSRQLKEPRPRMLLCGEFPPLYSLTSIPTRRSSLSSSSLVVMPWTRTPLLLLANSPRMSSRLSLWDLSRLKNASVSFYFPCFQQLYLIAVDMIRNSKFCFWGRWGLRKVLSGSIMFLPPCESLCKSYAIIKFKKAVVKVNKKKKKKGGIEKSESVSDLRTSCHK